MQELLMMNEYELVFAERIREGKPPEIDYVEMLDALIKIRSWKDCIQFCSTYSSALVESDLFDAKSNAEYVVTSPDWKGCPDMKTIFKFSLATQLAKLDSSTEYLDPSCFVYKDFDGSEMKPFLHDGKSYKGVSYRASMRDLPTSTQAQIIPGTSLRVIETRVLFETRDFFELLGKLIAVANQPSLNEDFAQVGPVRKVQFVTCENGYGVYAYCASLNISDLPFLYTDVDETTENERALGLVTLHKTLWGRVVASSEDKGVLFIGCGIDRGNFERAKQRVQEHPDRYGLIASPSGTLQVVVFADGKPDEGGWIDYDHGIPREGEDAVRLVCWATAKAMIENGCGRKRPEIGLRETGKSAFKMDTQGCLTEMLGEAACELALQAKISLCLTCKKPIGLTKGAKSSKYCSDTCKTNASIRRKKEMEWSK